VEKIVASEEHLSFEARLQLQRTASEALDLRGVFHIAVPGGSVATLIFPAFAEAQLDWTRVHVWWVDERVVPLTHADSNYKAAHDLWLAKVPAVAHPFHSISEYEKKLPRPLDVALLGVGPDGHVASLFPGHPALEVADKRALAIDDAPKPPPKRLTLTLKELSGAREVWIVATGGTKAQMLVKALKPNSLLPVSRVMREAEDVRLWVDPAAAEFL
jgi:6-phosphogluconolactonase